MAQAPIIVNSATTNLEIPKLGTFKVLEVQDKAHKPKCYRITGVPYAKPPVDELRFHRPVILAEDYDYSGDYTEFKGVCPQPPWPGMPPKTFIKYNEDCLYLNMWVPLGEPPENEKGWPVLYFIHGGWLQLGEPHHDSLADAQDLVALDITKFIVISPGYRLNLFGFLSAEELLEKDPKNANFGFWDQRAGLEWVHKNISYFKGNPDNITVGGLSAGAYSAFFQLAYELYHPEVDQIIKRSFFQSNCVAMMPKHIKESKDQFEELLTAFDIELSTSTEEKLQKLRAIPFQKLVDKLSSLKMFTFRAVIDDYFVPKTLMKDIYNGDYGRKFLASGRSLLIGEVNNEKFTYANYIPPKNAQDLTNKLNNYYPLEVTKVLLDVYPKLSKDATLDQVIDLYGRITSDLQVHVSERIFLNGLLKAGVPSNKVFRYKICFRGKYLDELLPSSALVPHAMDSGVWWYTKVSGILPKEEPKYLEWLRPYGEFIYGKQPKWGTNGFKQYRIFNSDGTIEVVDDDYWDWSQEVGNVLKNCVV